MVSSILSLSFIAVDACMFSKIESTDNPHTFDNMNVSRLLQYLRILQKDSLVMCMFSTWIEFKESLWICVDSAVERIQSSSGADFGVSAGCL